MNTEISYEIKEHIAILNTRDNGWRKELNLVSWNKSEPKLDIRDWNQSHDRMGRGITLKKSEMKAIVESMKGRL